MEQKNHPLIERISGKVDRMSNGVERLTVEAEKVAALGSSVIRLIFTILRTLFPILVLVALLWAGLWAYAVFQMVPWPSNLEWWPF